MTALRVLLVDHHDSFAFLLAEQFAARGARLCVIRCPDRAATLAAAAGRHRAQLVVLSPGPGHPAAVRATTAWLAARPGLPVFGVCLGHQVIALAAGAQVVR
ncbi:MAG TPA: anthranilate synthase component I, partial [Planctomycetota bacterium]|nr:anthranilate synthase component I [Planctomycetota bacterium]